MQVSLTFSGYWYCPYILLPENIYLGSLGSLLTFSGCGDSQSHTLFLLEVGNRSKGGGIVHRLQVKQNKAIRAVMGINPKECIGKKELLKCSKLTGRDEMSIRANYMLAWRLLSPQGDLADLREGRLRQHQHDHSTRSLISGVVTQQATYDSFIKKSAVIFNQIREETKLCP
jgi:hypothetical protein